VCAEVRAPAPGLDSTAVEEAELIGRTVAERAGVTGVLAVELFAVETFGEPTRLYVNELAMRPHNSGHWTQDGSVTSQFAQHLRAEGKDGDEEHAKEIREDIVNGVRDQIILDVLAEDLKVGVAQDELLEFLFQTAQQYGMEPAQFLQGAQQAGQIPAFVSEVARNKSLAMALRQAAVVDSKGETVDLSAFIGSDEDDAAATAWLAELERNVPRA